MEKSNTHLWEIKLCSRDRHSVVVVYNWRVGKCRTDGKYSFQNQEQTLMTEKKERNIVKSTFRSSDSSLILLAPLTEELSNYTKGTYFYWITHALV